MVFIFSKNTNYNYNSKPETPTINHQRRVAYLGFWLNNASTPNAVTALKNAGVTHLLATFIIHPDANQPITGTVYMLDAFNALSDTNKNLWKSNFKFTVSLGGASGVQSPFSDTFC